MKLSDYVARFLVERGIHHVFAITGGASVHLIDSISKTPGIDFICPQHEQAGAMMADAYSRVTGEMGVAISTSGPGATNMLTGVCCAFYDSVPALYLTGQVASFRMKGNRGIRQLGFQETDTVDIFKPVTKYAVLLDKAENIRYELEKAVHVARSGRPGPVLVDIPDDFQRQQIDPDQLKPYAPVDPNSEDPVPVSQVDACLRLLNQARRPVLVLGWGIRLSRAEAETRALVGRLGFPVLTSFAVRDFLPADNPLSVGAFGTHGTRYGNFAIQNSDLVLALGTRLDTRKSGTPPGHFARQARKIVVDVDPYELKKFRDVGIELDLAINADCKRFLQALLGRAGEISLPEQGDWRRQIESWKRRFPICPKEYFEEELINPYVFFKALSDLLGENEVIFSDTGCGLVWAAQSFEFKKGQRFFHAFNYTPMGYALPASIGASLALDNSRIICITGDGGLQMNIQELATVHRRQLPIKIFLVNNHGYSMIMQTQEQWLNKNYAGSTVDGGLAFPEFEKVAKAYGFRTLTIRRTDEVRTRLREVFERDDPVFCNLEIQQEHRVIPQVKFGRPLEDSEPFLPRKMFLENMIVDPVPESLED